MWQRGDLTVDTDPRRLDLALVHGFLSESYWARGRTLEEVERSVESSLSFGLYRQEAQVGFARVVSDLVSFAYLADVFVLPEERGRGLGAFLLSCVLAHPELSGVRTWMLFTRDAHGLYRRFGFGPLEGERHRRTMILEGRPA